MLACVNSDQKIFLVSLLMIGLVNQAFSQTQTCGILDDNGSDFLNPKDTIVSDPFFADVEVNTIIWEEKTRNVIAAAATNHPHYQYIGGLRFTSLYRYFVTDKTIDFLNVYPSPILREVKYTCADGSSVIYNFEFPIMPAIADLEQPKFHKSEYNFTITKDLPVGTRITQETFILAWDDDQDPKNGRLEFEIINNSPSLELRVEGSPLWNTSDPNPQSPFVYRVDLFLVNSIESDGTGSHYLTLRANSLLMHNLVSVTIEVV